jgi:hypothetical protein
MTGGARVSAASLHIITKLGSRRLVWFVFTPHPFGWYGES